MAEYLGSEQEQEFDELSKTLTQFKSGADKIWLKRMGRTETELWYEEKDFRNISVIILEWTHGNCGKFDGVDIPILLNSTPAETREYPSASCSRCEYRYAVYCYGFGDRAGYVRKP